jgi:hypothetical protein
MWLNWLTAPNIITLYVDFNFFHLLVLRRRSRDFISFSPFGYFECFKASGESVYHVILPYEYGGCLYSLNKVCLLGIESEVSFSSSGIGVCGLFRTRVRFALTLEDKHNQGDV